MSLPVRLVSLRIRVVAVAGALGLLLLAAALALVFMLGHEPGQQAQAAGVVVTGLNVDLSSTLGAGCNSDGTAKCSFPASTQFTVAFDVSNTGGVAYAGYYAAIAWSGSVQHIVGSLKLQGAGTWPDCQYTNGAGTPTPVGTKQVSASGTISFGCFANQQVVTYIGPMATLGFDCTSIGTGTITLLLGKFTGTANADFSANLEAASGSEALTVNCTSSPTYTPTISPTPTPCVPTCTPTDTPTDTPTITNTPTATPTPTFTPTPTITPTPCGAPGPGCPTPTPMAIGDDDGDGIDNRIDTIPNQYSENFSDVYLGGTTYGTLFHAPGLAVSITDEPSPGVCLGVNAPCIHITASGTGGPAPVVLFCDTLTRIYVQGGSNSYFKCGSASAKVTAGNVLVWFGQLVANLSAGNDVRVVETSSGVYSVTNNGANTASVGGISLSPGQTTTGATDSDRDGLANSAETALGTNPNNADSDADHVDDGLEVSQFRTNPLRADTDGGGATDGLEVTFGTNPLSASDDAPLLSADTDGDGCTNGREGGSNQMLGGRRDPLNPWDYFDPTHDRKVRSDDITAVVRHYGLQQGSPGYSTAYDRTYIGPNWWNLGPPNGKVRSDDITFIVRQYHQDCA